MALFGVEERKLMGGALVALGIAPFYFAFRAFRLKRRIEDTPTSKIRSMAMGLVELKGTVVPRELLLSPYTRKRCVYYDYKLERLEVRRFYSPSSRRWVKTEEWVLVRAETESRRFMLRDETGEVLIDPKDASVPDVDVYEEGFAPRRKHTEHLVLAGAETYIMGSALQNPENAGNANDRAGRLMIRKGDIDKDFVISSRSEKQLESNFALQFLGSIILGLMVMGLGAWMILFS
jgi:E3 ubiquitin ligase